MPLVDVLGIGKILPIDKLIDIVSSVTGRVSKSYFDRKDIDTKAYEIRKLAEARADEVKIMSKAIKDNFILTGGIDFKDEVISISSPKELQIESLNKEMFVNQSLEERTNVRLKFQDAKKQINIESVTAFAADELKNEHPITDEPIDDNWITRFFNIAEDISNEEMQALWGRILAGEIKRPKSFSIRTLEVLKNMTKEEADIYIKFAQFALGSSTGYYIYNPDNWLTLKNNYGLSYSDKLLLFDIGLILTENDSELTIFSSNPIDTSNIYNTVILYGKKGFFIKKKNVNQVNALKIRGFNFTRTGCELLKLVNPIYNENYINWFANNLKNNYFVKFGDIEELEDGKCRIYNYKEY